MSVEVVPVGNKKDRERFLRLPWRLYANDPAWVPNLLMLQRDVFSEKANPFFEHAEAQLFLALRDGEPVGRITAHIDRQHNEQHGEHTGFFGFFEAVDDAEVAHALLTAAEAWLRQRGMDSLRGPMNFSLAEECGMLIEGFDKPPFIGMTHTLPYYPALMEGAGYGKAMDLLAYRWDMSDPPERMMEAVARTREAPGLTVRKADMRHFQRDVDMLLDVYNDAWQSTWGFESLTPREAKKIASDLRLIVDPNVAIIAEVDGEPAGMLVGVPNLYEAIQDFKGFIDPWKAIKLLWRLKIRGPQTGRIMLFGVKPKFRTRELYGLPFVMLHELYLGAKKGRYRWCEESWILENNKPMNAIMPYWHAYVYKRYRLYEKAL